MPTSTESPLKLFQAEFDQIKAPRKAGQVIYPLNEVLFLILTAVISDCNEGEEIEDFGLDQLDWLRTYYPYKRGIPSSYTLNRVLSLINHQVFAFRAGSTRGGPRQRGRHDALLSSLGYDPAGVEEKKTSLGLQRCDLSKVERPYALPPGFSSDP